MTGSGKDADAIVLLTSQHSRRRYGSHPRAERCEHQVYVACAVAFSSRDVLTGPPERVKL